MKIARHFAKKDDRIALYVAISTVFTLIFTIFKLFIGIFYRSTWYLLFGIYSLVLFIIRGYFLYLYSKIRISNLQKEKRLKLEDHNLKIGGILYSFLGITFIGSSYYIFLHGTQQNYNKDIAILIATVGFYKIISSIISLFRVKKLKSPIITFLKAISIADALLSIVLTQYSILSAENSKYASNSTGRFGMIIGLILMIIGILITVRAFLKK